MVQASVKHLVTVKQKGYKCGRCSHEWVPRASTKGEPRVCPKCKSPYWNKPRKYKKAS